MTHLVLSLFPGLGLLDIAFEEQGFCVVRGPDLLWGGDIHTFHPPAGRFDGVIGGPPCQHWSTMRGIIQKRGHTLKPNLIPQFERCVAEAQPTWFVMENVPNAPPPHADGYTVGTYLLDNRWLGEEQSRRRAFSIGHRSAPIHLWRYLELAPLEAAAWSPAVMASGTLGPNTRRKGKNNLHTVVGPSWTTVKSALRLQGLPEDFLDRFAKETPLTARGAQRMIGNGVPLPMGRAIATAVAAALRELEAQVA